MEGDNWHQSRARAEAVLRALGTLKFEDAKTLQDAELDRVIMLLAEITGMLGQERLDRTGGP